MCMRELQPSGRGNGDLEGERNSEAALIPLEQTLDLAATRPLPDEERLWCAVTRCRSRTSKAVNRRGPPDDAV
jgi:hypothetical protein